MSGLTTKEKITRQVIALTDSHPFWAYLILKLKITEDTQGLIPEGAGAGINIKGELKYKKDFIDFCTEEELKFVLAHEVGHLVFGHLLRLGTRDPKGWNYATDFVLNSILQKDGFRVLNRDGFKCLLPDYHDKITIGNTIITDVSEKTAEELYDCFPKQKSETQQGFDYHEFSKGIEQQAEAIKEAEKWKNATAEAATYAKMRGNLPNGMENLIGNILDPKQNWKQILIKYVRNALPYDSTFSKPNKNFLAHGIIMPGQMRESIEIVVAIDTSGSVSDKEMSEFLGEMRGIAKVHRNVKMTVIQGDAEVEDVFDIHSRDIKKMLNFKRKGYGGTSHIPIFEYVKEKIPLCKLLIAFTDGYSDIDRVTKPNYDVIWGLTSNGTEEQIKWGRIVRMK